VTKGRKGRAVEEGLPGFSGRGDNSKEKGPPGKKNLVTGLQKRLGSLSCRKRNYLGKRKGQEVGATNTPFCQNLLKKRGVAEEKDSGSTGDNWIDSGGSQGS